MTFLMTVLTTLIPLLIVGSLIVIIIVFIRLWQTTSKKVISRKKMHWILGGYVMILFLSMIIYYLIPTNEEDSTQRPVLPRENWIIQNDENPIIEIDEKTTDYSIPELDYLDYIDPSLERGSWTFPYEKESIRIDMGYSDTGSWTVVTGRKNENDGEIDVTLYSEPYTVGNIDISDDIDFLNVDIGKDELYLYHPTEIELKYATYKKPFVYTQFRGGGFEDLDIRKPYYGLQVVYLEIPKDLELTTTLDQSIEIIEN